MRSIQALFAVCLAFALSGSASAQLPWMSVPDPETFDGGVITTLYYTPLGTLLSSSNTGAPVFRKEQSAATWTATNSPKNAYASDFASLGDSTVFTAALNGVYRSRDDGRTWTRLTAGLPSGAVASVAVFNEVLFAGHASAGIYWYSDSASAWRSLNAISLPQRVRLVRALTDSLYVFTSEGLYVGTGRDTNWRLMSEDFRVAVALSAARSGDSIFVGTDGFGLVMSADRGRTWTESSLNRPVRVSNVVVNTLGTKILALETDGYAWQSADNGRWHSSSEFPGYGLAHSTITDDIVIGTRECKVYRLGQTTGVRQFVADRSIEVTTLPTGWRVNSPQMETIVVEVYSTLGERICSAAGLAEVSVDLPAGVASGVYVLRCRLAEKPEELTRLVFKP